METPVSAGNALMWMHDIFQSVLDALDEIPVGLPPNITVEQPSHLDVIRVTLNDGGDHELRALWTACVAPLMKEIMEYRDRRVA